MKFKKTMLLMFLLVLAIGLTGCDNWQSGLDEIEDATGPSWDLDLSIPLLPATNVDVGEELAREFDEDGEFKLSLLDDNLFEKTVDLNEDFNGNGLPKKISASVIIGELNEGLDNIELENIEIPVFDEMGEYIKPTSSSLELLIDLSSDIEGLRFKFETFKIKVGNQEVGEDTGGFRVKAGEDNKLPESYYNNLFDVLYESEEKEISIEIGEIGKIYGDDEFEIEKLENKIKANLKMNFYLEFEFVADEDDPDNFIYRAEPEEFDLEEDTRDALSNNLRSVEIVQEIVNELPFSGEIEIFIRGDEVDKDEFYDDGDESIYSSGLINLKKDNQRYRYQEELGEDFIEALTEESPVYIGYRIKIPIDEDEPVRFSTNDRIELKMWSNVTVRVNSQD